jgi:single-stranded-DNA-specific exonuclease
MGEDKHLRLSVEAGGVRARAVAFGAGSAGSRREILAVDGDEHCDVTVRLEAREWNGAVEPRLILRGARACTPAPVEVVGEPSPEAWLRAALGLDAVAAPAAAQPTPLGAGPAAALAGGHRTVIDRRGAGSVAVLADLVGTGEPVLAVVADVARRRPGLAERTGGYALCSWAALEADPGLAAAYRHVVVLDPPAVRPPVLPGAGWTLLAWGPDELRFTVRMHEHEHDLRPSLADLFRSLRGRDAVAGDELAAVLRGEAARPRSAAHAGRLVRVLSELGLVRVDADPPALTVVSEERTALERSPTYVAATERLEDGRRFLGDATVPLAA